MDAALVRLRRRLDKALEHEAVHLRLGKRVGAFLLDRVLRGEHEERLGQLVGGLANRDLTLLHRLEERALHLRRRAVDFVREQHVREHGALLRRELARLRGVDERAHHVRRQQVRRERDAFEVKAKRLRERVHAQRLREARHALKQDVAVRDEREDKPVDQLFLSDDDLAHLVADAADEFALCGDFVRCVRQIHFFLLLVWKRGYFTPLRGGLSST